MPGHLGHFVDKCLGVNRGTNLHIIIEVHEDVARNPARRFGENVPLFGLATPLPIP